MSDPTEDENVSVDQLRYEHDNGVTVKLRRRDGMWGPSGTRYPAEWSDTDYGSDEWGVGETMDEDEIEARKGEAIAATRDIDGVRDSYES